MKKAMYVLGVIAIMAVALPLHAQDGCVDSPEAPTAILAIAGSASAFLMIARARFNARKSRKD